MKKVSGYFSENIPIVKLFLVDIEEITNILSTNFDEIEMIVDDFELENTSEIQYIKKDMITNLSISAYDKKDYFRELKIKLYIRKYYASLDIQNKEDIKCLGIKKKIFDILDRRLNFMRFIKSTSKAMFIYFLYCILIVLLIFLLYIDKEYINSISFIFGFLGILSLIMIDKMIYNKVFLSYYIKSPKFFKRNKDMLIVGIASAIIGTVLGGLIIYFITK